MFEIVLLRHGESVWNKENLFTGWTDIDLSENGMLEAHQAGAKLKELGYHFDLCFTSYLKRAIHTLNIVLDEMDLNYIPVLKSWKLNERHYGALQGLNKVETALKYGEEQVKLWRRSYDVNPPKLEENDKRNPALQDAYSKIDKDKLPLSESLKDTVSRVVPYFQEEIKPFVKSGKKVIIVAHGNSLRSLVMYLEKMTEKEVVDLNIPTGIPLVYTFDDNFNILKKEYLISADELDEKIQQVKKQSSIK